MSTYQNILIDAPIEGSEYERLFSLKGNPLITKSTKVTLINVYNSKFESSIPLSIDRKNLNQVEHFILEKLENLKRVIDPKDKNNWEVKVLFNSEIKNACVFFARQIKADLIIISTRGIEMGHVQNESFAQYMLESSSSDLLVLMPIRS